MKKQANRSAIISTSKYHITDHLVVGQEFSLNSRFSPHQLSGPATLRMEAYIPITGPTRANQREWGLSVLWKWFSSRRTRHVTSALTVISREIEGASEHLKNYYYYQDRRSVKLSGLWNNMAGSI